MDLKEQKGKVKINSHLEAHGSYSIEWSYHFPLTPGLRIESELELFFPREKLPGAARHSLSESNLANTRLSLADAAAEVRNRSVKFLRDSRWLRNNLLQEQKNDQLSPRIVEHTVAAFVLRAKNYWSPSFVSGTGLFVQSDLKQSSQAFRNFFRDRHSGQPFDWSVLPQLKRNLGSSFRAAFRIVEVYRDWQRIFDMVGVNAFSLKDLSGRYQDDTSKFLGELRDLAEFAIMLMCRAIAECQGAVAEARASLEGQKDVECEITKVETEKTWLCLWAELANELRVDCRLPTLSEVTIDPISATVYFERMRELQRLHYQAFDLDLNLRPNELRYDFVIGAAAAGISALVAFMGILIWTFFQTDGSVTFQQQSVVGLVVFAVGNVVVYILKDRLKEWLKKRFRKILQSGRSVGDCVLMVPGENGGPEVPMEIAEVEREVWWSRMGEDWIFHIWEEFRVTPHARTAGARIIKQVWRLPLDEILHSLDDSQHILKVPSTDGMPREVPVLKRSSFPFKTTVIVKGWKNKKLSIVDHEHVEGKVVTSGRRIFSIE